MLHAQAFTRLPFSMACGFNTLSLAHVLDSLVRVSRRVVSDRCVWNQALRDELRAPHNQLERTSKLARPKPTEKTVPITS